MVPTLTPYISFGLQRLAVTFQVELMRPNVHVPSIDESELAPGQVVTAEMLRARAHYLNANFVRGYVFWVFGNELFFLP